MNWLDSLPIDQTVMTWLFAISILTFLGSLILIPWLIIRLPHNYFRESRRHRSKLHEYHPLAYFLIVISKNLFGIVLILAGVVMLLLPGQGILAILVGVGLTDFPGKYRLERWFARKPAIFRAMNWVRQRRGVIPLEAP